MKKAFILAGFTSMLLACNNNSNTGTDNRDSSHHSGHNEKSSDTKNKDQVNAVKETMDKMMQKMHTMKITGNNDIDFAAMMIEHHNGAVEMSKVEITKGTNAELKAFAQKVIDDQTKEITFMQEAISKAPKATSGNSADFQKALSNSMMAMMNDATVIYNDMDKDFAAQMKPHHQSAVDMAKAYLDYGRETSLKTLCRNIINSQTKEINWLTEWLAKYK
ncbi:MAG: DUF305 domain-containing protein [Ferruginibacter sp.]